MKKKTKEKKIETRKNKEISNCSHHLAFAHQGVKESHSCVSLPLLLKRVDCRISERLNKLKTNAKRVNSSCIFKWCLNIASHCYCTQKKSAHTTQIQISSIQVGLLLLLLLLLYITTKLFAFKKKHREKQQPEKKTVEAMKLSNRRKRNLLSP